MGKVEEHVHNWQLAEYYEGDYYYYSVWVCICGGKKDIEHKEERTE